MISACHRLPSCRLKRNIRSPLDYSNILERRNIEENPNKSR